MERQTIRREGERAVERFINLVDGAKVSDNARLGDVIVPVDGKESYVELKECHAELGSGGTINQVRPIKYICCVIWAPNHGCWYVMSPDQLVRLAAQKNRGHHNEIPFECMNFSLRGLGDGFHTKCDDPELTKTVAEAIRRGERYGSVKSLMNDLLAEIKRISEKYKKDVRDGLP